MQKKCVVHLQEKTTRSLSLLQGCKGILTAEKNPEEIIWHGERSMGLIVRTTLGRSWFDMEH